MALLLVAATMAVYVFIDLYGSLNSGDLPGPIERLTAEFAEPAGELSGEVDTVTFRASPAVGRLVAYPLAFVYYILLSGVTFGTMRGGVELLQVSRGGIIRRP